MRLFLRGDELLKGAAYLPDAFLDPATSHSVKPTEAPFNIAYKTEKPVFAWYDEKENEEKKIRFGIAMEGTTRMEPPDAILQGLLRHRNLNQAFNITKDLNGIPYLKMASLSMLVEVSGRHHY